MVQVQSLRGDVYQGRWHEGGFGQTSGEGELRFWRGGWEDHDRPGHEMGGGILTRHARRVDENQPEVVKAFRGMGCSVLHLHMAGKGVQDIAVGYGGLTALVEIKTEKGKYKPAQEKVMSEWTGGYYTVRSLDDVERIVSMLRNWRNELANVPRFTNPDSSNVIKDYSEVRLPAERF